MDYRADKNLSDEQRLVIIEEIVGELRQRLYGNGQPGDIEKICLRLSALEEFRWKFAGAFGVALFVWEIVRPLAPILHK